MHSLSSRKTFFNSLLLLVAVSFFFSANAARATIYDTNVNFDVRTDVTDAYTGCTNPASDNKVPTGVTSSQATVWWGVQSGATGTQYSVTVEAYAGGHTTRSCSVTANSAARSCTITTLDASTTYNWRIASYCITGNTRNDNCIDSVPIVSGQTIVTSAAGGPTVPASLGQFKNDGTTAVSNGSWLKSSDTGNIKLQATTTEAVSHTLTLYFQLLQNGGTFDGGTGIPTSTCAGGSAYPCSGSSPINIWSVASSGSVTSFTNTPMQIPVADYATGYKWQVKACDGTDCSSWTKYSNPSFPNFYVDTVAPASGSASNTNGYQTSASVTANVNRGSDATSGMSATNSDYLLEYDSATLSAGSCGSYSGTYSDAGVAETAAATSYTYAGTTDKCYKFRYSVKDVAGNPATYTGTDVTKVDTAAPSGGSISYANGYQSSLSVPLTGADGTDGISGINTASRQFQRRSTTLSGGTCNTGGWGSWANAGSAGGTGYTDTIAANLCYQYQYLVSDNAGNQQAYTSTNAVYSTQPTVTITLPSADSQTMTSDSSGNYGLSYTLGYYADATFASGTVVFNSGLNITCTLPSNLLTASVAGTPHNRVNLSNCDGSLVKGTVYTLTVSVIDANSATATATRSNITYGGIVPGWTQDKWVGTATTSPQYAFHQWDQSGFTNFVSATANGFNLTGSSLFDSLSLAKITAAFNPSSDAEFTAGGTATFTNTADDSPNGRVGLVSLGGFYGNDHATDTLNADFNAGTTTNIYVANDAIYPKKPGGYACSDNNYCQSGTCEAGTCFQCGTSTVAYSGTTYDTVNINGQCWFKQNLNVGTILANGNTMPSDPFDYNSVQKWCPAPSGTAGSVDNTQYSANCNSDGGLYTWAEAMGLPLVCNTSNTGGCVASGQIQGICPAGWHIPTDTEQYNLENYLKDNGQTCNAARGGWDCTTAGSKLSTLTLNGNNSSGFTAILAGARGTDGSFSGRSGNALFWSSLQYGASSAWLRYLYSGHATVFRGNGNKANGFSVRCLKN